MTTPNELKERAKYLGITDLEIGNNLIGWMVREHYDTVFTKKDINQRFRYDRILDILTIMENRDYLLIVKDAETKKLLFKLTPKFKEEWEKL